MSIFSILWPNISTLCHLIRVPNVGSESNPRESPSFFQAESVQSRSAAVGSARRPAEPGRGYSHPPLPDLEVIDIPVLVMHGEDDQICPFPTTSAPSVKLLKLGTLKSYPRLPHRHATSPADIINPDLLAFIKS